MPSLISRTALALLILHALANIAQGMYCITQPQAWLSLAPSAFTGSPDAAVQAIGTIPFSFFLSNNTLVQS